MNKKRDNEKRDSETLMELTVDYYLNLDDQNRKLVIEINGILLCIFISENELLSI